MMVREWRGRRAEGYKCGNGLLFHNGDQQVRRGARELEEIARSVSCDSVLSVALGRGSAPES